MQKSVDDCYVLKGNSKFQYQERRARSSSPVKNRKALPSFTVDGPVNAVLTEDEYTYKLSTNKFTHNVKAISSSPMAKKLHITTNETNPKYVIPIPFQLKMPPKLSDKNRSQPTSPTNSIPPSPVRGNKSGMLSNNNSNSNVSSPVVAKPIKLVYNGVDYEEMENYSSSEGNMTNDSIERQLRNINKGSKPKVMFTKRLSSDVLSVINEGNESSRHSSMNRALSISLHKEKETASTLDPAVTFTSKDRNVEIKNSKSLPAVPPTSAPIGPPTSAPIGPPTYVPTVPPTSVSSQIQTQINPAKSTSKTLDPVSEHSSVGHPLYSTTGIRSFGSTYFLYEQSLISSSLNRDVSGTSDSSDGYSSSDNYDTTEKSVAQELKFQSLPGGLPENVANILSKTISSSDDSDNASEILWVSNQESCFLDNGAVLPIATSESPTSINKRTAPVAASPTVSLASNSYTVKSDDTFVNANVRSLQSLKNEDTSLVSSPTTLVNFSINGSNNDGIVDSSDINSTTRSNSSRIPRPIYLKEPSARNPLPNIPLKTQNAVQREPLVVVIPKKPEIQHEIDELSNLEPPSMNLLEDEIDTALENLLKTSLTPPNKNTINKNYQSSPNLVSTPDEEYQFNNGMGKRFSFPNNLENATNEVGLKEEVAKESLNAQRRRSFISDDGKIEIPELDDINLEMNTRYNSISPSKFIPSTEEVRRFQGFSKSRESLISTLNRDMEVSGNYSMPKSKSNPNITDAKVLMPSRRHSRFKSLHNIEFDYSKDSANIPKGADLYKSRSFKNLTQFASTSPKEPEFAKEQNTILLNGQPLERNKTLPKVPLTPERNPTEKGSDELATTTGESPIREKSLRVEDPPNPVRYEVDFIDKKSKPRGFQGSNPHAFNYLQVNKALNSLTTKPNATSISTLSNSSYQSSRSAKYSTSTRPSDTDSIVMDLTDDKFNICTVKKVNSITSYRSVTEVKNGKEVEVILVDDDDNEDDLDSIYSRYRSGWNDSFSINSQIMSRPRRTGSTNSSASTISNDSEASYKSFESGVSSVITTKPMVPTMSKRAKMTLLKNAGSPQALAHKRPIGARGPGNSVGTLRIVPNGYK